MNKYTSNPNYLVDEPASTIYPSIKNIPIPQRSYSASPLNPYSHYHDPFSQFKQCSEELEIRNIIELK